MGLVITMLVVLVVFIVGTSAMAWATNDTDASVQEELSHPALGAKRLLGDANGQSSIYLLIAADKSYAGTVTPLWDSWNDCVNDDYTRERRYKDGDSVQLSVTTRCFCEHSRMHWRITSDYDSGYDTVELHEDACSGSVHAEYGDRTATHFGCAHDRKLPAYMLLCVR